MKQVPTVVQLKLPFRDERVVDSIVGKKRQSIADYDTVDFADCQLAKAYPNYHDFLEEIYRQRQTQKAGGPLAHPRAIHPLRVKTRPLMNGKVEPPPWEDGPSVGDVNRAYKTTDRGR